MKRFLEAERTTESLDDERFARLTGSNGRADYLVGSRRFVAELKTINGDPKDRVEQRLRERLALPGSPLAFGQVGVSQVLERLPDEQEVLKVMNDLSGRVVRRHLQKANEQIEATKSLLRLNDAAGLAIIMNDSERMIDAANIGYSIKSAMEAVAGSYLGISYVWASIECHRIRTPAGIDGFPQLLVTKSLGPSPELDFLARMLNAWAASLGSILHSVPHNGDWNTMLPIYDGGPPVLQPYG